MTADSIQSRLRQAVALHQAGTTDKARLLYEEILGEDPRQFDALHLLGVIAAQSADPRAALRWFDRALGVNPGSAVAHFNRGTTLQGLGLRDGALESYDRAIGTRPDYAEAHFNRGVVLADLVQWEAALSSFERAIQCHPAYAAAHVGRGDVLRKLGRLDAALASCNHAIALNPRLAEAYVHRGLVLRELNQREAAVASCDQAIALQPDYAQAWCDRGNLLYELHQLPEAVASFDAAVAINPEFIGAHSSRSMALLLAGDLQAGWTAYDWRLKCIRDGAVEDRANFAQPRWNGTESLAGKAILLHSEQGLGDTVQFCRYAARVAERGARVILEVPRVLMRLLRGLDGVAELVAQGDPLPQYDYHCPLPSLPRAFGTVPATIPARIPYLRVDAELMHHWQSRLARRSKPRVGLVWSGGFRPHQPELWGVNSRRNIALAKLAALRRDDIEFYSLQKGQPAESELAELRAGGWSGPDLIDLTAEIRDFADTAALIGQLDLVISVDTSTAHVAGALGKPVWIMNRFDTCWRWMLDRRDSPWYPTVRLYRQLRPGDWDDVVRRIGADLDQWVAAPS